jgi:cytochrome c-type biogenesis protein
MIPGYISFISGYSIDELRRRDSGPGKIINPVFLSSLLFVAGFAVVFVIMGATATFLGGLISENRGVIKLIGGIIIIILGLHIAGITPLKFLYQEKRLHIGSHPLGYLGAFFVGIVFAIGWTPCVGPFLAGTLALAGTKETVYQGMGLLAIYSLGFGLPFILVALAINWFLGFFQKVKRLFRVIEIMGGLILVAVGILLISADILFPF